MQLSDIAKLDGGAIPLETLSGDKGLAREVQGRLSLCGLLDPPLDGVFGSVSEWALDAFCVAKKLNLDENLTSDAAKALLADDINTLFPLHVGDDFAGKIVAAMQRRGYWICRHPKCFNIVYVEGINKDGTLNDNQPNVFNDLRVLIQVDADGTVKIANSWEGTTEPGRFFTMHPLDSRGAARIKFGQYKSWRVGIHHPGKASAHEALVQAADIVIYRDTNKTFKREGKRYTGIFAVNQHWGYDQPKGDLGKTSAGCLVGRAKDGHRAFMTSIKSDPRYESNNGYLFVTAVLPSSSIDETSFDPTTDH